LSKFFVSGGNQLFEYSKKHQIASGEICLDTKATVGVVKLADCSGVAERSQQWDYDNQVSHFCSHLFLVLLSLSNLTLTGPPIKLQYFRNRQTGTCLAINSQNNNAIVTVVCDANDPLHKWDLVESIFA
jgi:hypothetical protein